MLGGRGRGRLGGRRLVELGRRLGRSVGLSFKNGLIGEWRVSWYCDEQVGFHQ